MYGEESLNAHHVIKYALIKEFFEGFKFLRFKDIEIPLTIINYFQVHIRHFVDDQLSNEAYLESMKRKHKLTTIKDVQSVLLRKPSVRTDLSKEPGRNRILLPARLLSFALDKLQKHQILLIVSTVQDRIALIGKVLPNNFQVFDYYSELRRVKVSSAVQNNVMKSITNLVRANHKHPIFGSKTFSKWLYTRSLLSIKSITVLENMIMKCRIGIMMDHIEIVNPGTTLALLGNKYNIPFINIPQLLVADRTMIPSRASHYAVWGIHYKEWLERRGIASNKITITGNLKFEYANRVIVDERNSFIAKWSIPPEHLVVTYTSQHFVNSVNSTIMNWIDKVTNHSSLPVTFLIKPHPGDKFDYSLYKDNHRIRILPKSDEIYNIMGNSDVVMTISSNTAIEAASLKKAIIVLQPLIPYDYDLNYNDFHAHLVHASAGLAAFGSEDLLLHLKKLIRRGELRTSLQNQAANFISKTLQSSVPPSMVTLRLINCILRQKNVLVNKMLVVKRKKAALIRKRLEIIRKKQIRALALKNKKLRFKKSRKSLSDTSRRKMR
ncbi:hypothetical protein [Paenibacillus sp. Soil522]|uniref:hypothetical protein n=1 Tax=Paenibacillus sp. Soil522 TaxID=1736388 RepID=UPI0006F36EB5|nr:hypothetical protein [Paenibacillus sp. Soil522]KRE46301.1 hypothetical protein ASG81_11895 [Paenibacillus sp. Soil522]